MTNRPKLGIYIHIPFCMKKCDYCDFLSGPETDETIEKYVKQLVKEIGQSKKLMDDYLVDTIFIGGGTPSCINENYINEIVSVLYENCKTDSQLEFTIECNPGTLNKEKLLMYKEIGINRLSVGLQTANDKELQSIGRIHTWKDFEENYLLARELGFGNINVDLMSSLPGQSITSYENTIDKVLNLKPNHISAYSLIVEKGTKLYNRVKCEGTRILPNEDDERSMYYLTERLLNKSGYKRYEISNYSLKGYECRHNIGYWKRKDYLGFGLGAASLYKNVRYNNTDSLQAYIRFKCSKELLINREELSEKDRMEEYMFLGLRLIEGINIEEFNHEFDQNYYNVYGNITTELVKNKLIIEEAGRIKLSKRGIDVSNVVLAEFLL